MGTDSIISEIEEHVGDTDYSDWYAGITEDPYERRREHERNVDVMDWKHCKAHDADDARFVEDHFQDLGMEGGPGGGDDNSKYVYVYRFK